MAHLGLARQATGPGPIRQTSIRDATTPALATGARQRSRTTAGAARPLHWRGGHQPATRPPCTAQPASQRRKPRASTSWGSSRSPGDRHAMMVAGPGRLGPGATQSRRSRYWRRAFMAWITSSLPLSKPSTTTSRRRPAVSNPRRSCRAGLSSSRSQTKPACWAAWIASQGRCRACVRSRGPSHDVGADGRPDGLRAADVVALGTFGQRGQQGGVDPNGDDLCGAVADRLAAALAQLVNVVATFGLVGPALDVLLGDWLALDGLHNRSVIRNGCEGKRARPENEPRSQRRPGSVSRLVWTRSPGLGGLASVGSGCLAVLAEGGVWARARSPREVIPCPRATILLPFQPSSMSTAQLAAVSFLARYSGRTHRLVHLPAQALVRLVRGQRAGPAGRHPARPRRAVHPPPGRDRADRDSSVVTMIQVFGGTSGSPTSMG